MKIKTQPLIKTFLFMSYDANGPKQISSFQGKNLIQTISLQFQHSKKFMHWNETYFGAEETPSLEKAIKTIYIIEESRRDEKYIVMDITDPTCVSVIFPKNKQPPDFDDIIIGYKYTIESYIKTVDDEDQAKFNSFNEAESELEHLQTLQPENVYKIRNVTKDEIIITS